MFVAALLPLILLLPGSLGGVYEKKLLQTLFESTGAMRHNKMERPVKNDSELVYVWLKVSLQQIIDVDEKNQILYTNMWLDLTWRDYHFVWNPEDYGGITKINVDPSRVWRPDILLYNSADEKFDGTYPTNVVISNTGDMSFIPPGMFKSTCKIDITWFPFDTQKCFIKFGAWTYDGGMLDLRFKCANGSLNTTEKRLNDPNKCSEMGEGDTSTYIESGEWSLEGMTGQRYAVDYDCCPYPFIDLKYFIRIRRRTLYYGFNLIIPCVLISTMALLTFVLPPDAGEKISLGVTILLSLVMFQMLVADTMPQTSEALPLIGMYFACTMIMCSLSVVFTVIVLNYHHRDAESHPIPNWVKKLICTYLAHILCMRDNREDDKEPIYMRRKRGSTLRQSSLREANTSVEMKERSSKSLLANVLDLEDDIRTAVGPMLSSSGIASPPSYTNCIGQPGNGIHLQQQAHFHQPQQKQQQHEQLECSTKSDLASVLRELQVITKKISDDTADGEVSSEWKFAARVVDRLCLILFSCFTVISTCAILFSAPDVFKG